MPSSRRLDCLLVERGLIASRELARRMVLAGEVRVNGQVHTKAGQRVPEAAELTVAATPRFVGRGGEKLQAAFDRFELSVQDADCLDIGASTGGFTDCLLQHGARHVVAVDVGKGQLHWKLRNDPRVTVIEGFNARFLQPADVPVTPTVATFDVSFISLTLVMPPVTQILAQGGVLVTLIKPQFEAGREQVGKGGVIRDEAVRQAVVARIRAFGEQTLGLAWVDHCESPLRGPAGNLEYVAMWRKAE
jgi:23S rRNA (cytidine1920-2'-O)/16S rRNA (cytidine1409-2'-O)-methyltransferase